MPPFWRPGHLPSPQPPAPALLVHSPSPWRVVVVRAVRGQGRRMWAAECTNFYFVFFYTGASESKLADTCCLEAGLMATKIVCPRRFVFLCFRCDSSKLAIIYGNTSVWHADPQLTHIRFLWRVKPQRRTNLPVLCSDSLVSLLLHLLAQAKRDKHPPLAQRPSEIIHGPALNTRKLFSPLAPPLE